MVTAKDAAAQSAATGTAVEPRRVDSLIQYLQRRAEADEGSRAYDVAASQLEKILAAEDENEFWEASDYTSLGGRDLEDVEQTINSFTVHVADNDEFDAALGHYVMVNASKIEDGEELIWNTQSPLIIGQLRWLEAKNLLPYPCVIKGTKARKGRVIKLRPLSKRPVQASTS
jgi:hypothetical protein